MIVAFWKTFWQAGQGMRRVGLCELDEARYWRSHLGQTK